MNLSWGVSGILNYENRRILLFYRFLFLLKVVPYGQFDSMILREIRNWEEPAQHGISLGFRRRIDNLAHLAGNISRLFALLIQIVNLYIHDGTSRKFDPFPDNDAVRLPFPSTLHKHPSSLHLSIR